MHLGFGSFENSTHPVLAGMSLYTIVIIIGLPQLTDIHTTDTGVMNTMTNQLLSLLQLNISIRNDITKISIPANQYNTIEELDISGFPFLETIVIGNNCFKRVRKVWIYNLPSLVNITIGDMSFFPKTDADWDNDDFTQPNEFHLFNCSALESVILQRGSFLLYETIDFHSKGIDRCIKVDLPSLKTLEFGNPYTLSYNGVRAPLIVKDFPSLETLAIGGYAGMDTKFIQFESND